MTDPRQIQTGPLRGEEEGSGPPVVLLHGLTATRRYVLQGSRLLARRGYRVIGYDARGHGDSDPASDPAAYEYPDLVSDLREVLDALELDRPVLVGSSMGAATAMALALEDPERVAALVQITPAYDGAPRGGAADLAEWREMADALDRDDIEAFVALAGADRVPDPLRVTVATAIRQRIERHRDLGPVADALRVVPGSAAFAGLDALEGLTLPVLVVASRDEADPSHPMAVAQEYARRLPRARLVVEGPGESPLAWRGASLSRAIEEFLDELPRYS